MAKNKKNQSAGVRFGPALKAFLLCAMIGGSAIGYLWQKNKVNELGREISKHESAIKQLRDQNFNLRKQLNSLRSLPSLEARVKKMNLGLDRPLPTQIVRLPEPAARPVADGGRQYAAQ